MFDTNVTDRDIKPKKDAQNQIKQLVSSQRVIVNDSTIESYPQNQFHQYSQFSREPPYRKQNDSQFKRDLKRLKEKFDERGFLKINERNREVTSDGTDIIDMVLIICPPELQSILNEAKSNF